MRLSFNHKYSDNLFSYSKNSYDPEKVIDTIISKTEIISDYYKLNFRFKKEPFREYEIKHSDIYCMMNFYITDVDRKIDLTYNILIPDIRNSFINISGVRRYVQNQIRDTLFVDLKNKNREKIITEYDRDLILSLYQKRGNKFAQYNFNVSGHNFMNAVGLYMYLLEDKDENKLHRLDNPIIETNINAFENIIDKGKDFLLRNISPQMSLQQKKKSIDYVKLYYKVSDLLQEYFESVSDIIYNLFVNLHNEKEKINGLDLRNRRVRNSYEMVYGQIISKIIDYTNETVNIMSKNKREREIRIEPFQSLYDFILVENMFESPLASVANVSRCTITGHGGFSSTSIPVNVKNIHPSQYGCIDPSVTPDRDRAGVVLYLSTTAELDKFGRFKIDEEFMKKFNL